MPASWQQFIPFYIDAFKSSPAVQAMHPAARAGYWYLLSQAWQSEDCALPADDKRLMEISGLGARLWKKHRANVLENFETLDDGRLRNVVCHRLWQEAEKVSKRNAAAREKTGEQRRVSGRLGAAKRWAAHGKQHGKDDGKAMANTNLADGKDDGKCHIAKMANDSLTGTVTGTETGTEEKQKQKQKQKPGADTSASHDSAPNAEADDVEFPEGLTEDQYAWRVLEAAAIPPHAPLLRRAAASAIAMLARMEKLNMPTAAKQMLERIREAQEDGVQRWLQWFQDGEWKKANRVHLPEDQ